ncbi:MAG: hypothetical protein WCK35_14620 [Chloroflexota bacterium]
MQVSTIGGINLLAESIKREIYVRAIPYKLFEKFNLTPTDVVGNGELLRFKFKPGSSDVEIYLFHEKGFPDPIFYGHLSDTLNGQIHILLYILNNPNSPRFDVDVMPDGSVTRFGTLQRNIPAELSALNANLAPGQVRKGLRLLSQAIFSFENFVTSLGHDIYFVEPLYYHNAIIFERYGFAYQQGRKLMDEIEVGFNEGGKYFSKLGDSLPFRSEEASNSIRLRSWAIHDGILGFPFTDITMYKHIRKNSGISTCPSCVW